MATATSAPTPTVGGSGGYTTYNSNGTVASFTPTATYKAQVASDVASGKDTPTGVGGAINQNVVGKATAGVIPDTINSSNTAAQTSIVLPTPKAPPSTGTDVMTAVGAQNSVYQNAIQATAAAQDKATGSSSGTDALKTQLALLAGIPQKQNALSDPAVTAAHDQMIAAQNQTNQDTALLNAITTKATTDKLSLIGQGNGVPGAIIGGQQAEIDREAAIQSLPVAAKIAIDQGNLKVAQDNLTYMTSVVQEKVNNAYDNATATYNAISGFVSKSESATLDALKTTTANAVTAQRDAINNAADYAKLAITNGNGALAAQLMKYQATIGGLNPTSATYATDLKNAQNSVATIASQIKPKAPTLTVADQKQASLTALSNIVQTNGGGKSTPGTNGIPVIDQFGFITPEALKYFIAHAPSEGLTAADVVTTLAPQISRDNGTVAPAYGLNKALSNLVNAAS